MDSPPCGIVADAARVAACLVKTPLFSPRLLFLVVAMVWFIFVPFVGFLNLLGFTAAGPAVGSFAAWWMSFYGAAVPAGSLFALIQTWAMTSSVAWLGLWLYAPFAVGIAWIGAMFGR